MKKMFNKMSNTVKTMTCKARVIPYRIRKGYSKPTQNRMDLPICTGTPTTVIPGQTSKDPVFKPCLRTLKLGK